MTVGYYDTYDGPHNQRCRRQRQQRRLGRRRPQRRRPDRHQRHDDGLLGVQDGRLRRLERPRLGHAEHLERAGLGQRPRGRAVSHPRGRWRKGSRVSFWPMPSQRSPATPVRVTRSAIIGTIVVLLIAGLCVRLGFWQLARLRQKRALNAGIATRMALPPLELNQGIGDL